MRTMQAAQTQVTEDSTGDLHRDLSELGLAFQEVWAASQGALDFLGERNPNGVSPNDVPMLLQIMFIYGVMTGVKFERAR